MAQPTLRLASILARSLPKAAAQVNNQKPKRICKINL